MTGAPSMQTSSLNKPSSQEGLKLTGRHRYNQAIRLARIRHQRLFREFIEGESQFLECSGDMDREHIIRELDRAYEAGYVAALKLPDYRGGEKIDSTKTAESEHSPSTLNAETE